MDTETVSTLQYNLARSPEFEAAVMLQHRCAELFPSFNEMTTAELFRQYEKILRNRTDDRERHWLQCWYLQRLMNDRASEGSNPPVTTVVGQLLVFLADEVDRWTATESRFSPEIIDSLTQIILQLKRADDGFSMDFKIIEHAAIEVCIGLELCTGDETTLLRFGQALKDVKRLTGRGQRGQEDIEV